MKLITPSFEIIPQAEGRDGMLKHIEQAGRICYMSEDKITAESAKEFVSRMIVSQHLSVLEHGTVYLKIENTFSHATEIGFYMSNHYSRVRLTSFYAYITTNYRVIVEHNLQSHLRYMCQCQPEHYKRVSVKFGLDRVTGESFLRHRAIDEDTVSVQSLVTRAKEKDIDSFARQSTRYCNYSKSKFGHELSIVPAVRVREKAQTYMEGVNFLSDDNSAFRQMCSDVMSIIDTEPGYESLLDEVETYLFANLAAQWSYMRLCSRFGWSAEEARSILPIDIFSPLFMTAYVEDWQHFFLLRCDEHAHPMARELAIPLRQQFVSLNLIKEE